ncbi:MAG: hypothetical protein LM590_15655 [Thermofilum sp.]|nr:hypothetical protein [Thermofilum sp.]
MAKYLFVDGGLHSFVDEIGRFTKTSGFHYDVYLHPPRIVHHHKYWEVKPWGDGSFLVNEAIWIYRDRVEDERGRRYEGLRCPFNAIYTAEELYNRIIEAALKYALARFLRISANGEKLTLRISFKLYAEDAFAIEPTPIAQELKLLREFDDSFLREIGTLVKRDSKLRLNYVVTLHPPRIHSYNDPLWGWEVKPSRLYYTLVLGERYGIGERYIIDEKTNEWFDGVATSTLYEQKLYLPASAIYNAIIEAIAKYVLVKFLGRQAKEYEGKEMTISFESTR